MGFLAPAALFLSVGTAAMQGISMYQQGQAASKAAAYNAQVAEQNAKLATQNAEFAGAQGEADLERVGLKNRAQQASILTSQAANGIDVTRGSAVDVRASQAELGELDALNVRSRAVREAYGYQTQAKGFEGEAGLERAKSKSAKRAGIIGGAGTLIGGIANAGLNFSNAQNAKGLSTDDLISGENGISYSDSYLGTH